jgi:hypothetical protein
VDNDNYICQLAEACGGYPTISDLEDIEVTNTDVSNLDFLVDILSNFGATSAQAGEGVQTSGIARPPATPKQLAQ